MSIIGDKIVNRLTKFRDQLKEENVLEQPKKTTVKPYEKPKVAVCYPSPVEGEKKIVVMVPGKFVRETFGIQHESLSVIRDWCQRYGYVLDTSRLNRPVKPKYVPEDNSDSYSYR